MSVCSYMHVCRYVHMSTGACKAKSTGCPRAGVTGGCKPPSVNAANSAWVSYKSMHS